LKHIRQVSYSAVIVAALLIAGCSKKKTDPGLVFERVTDPVRELCIDDSRHHTREIQVPFLRFDEHITLNGTGLSEVELSNWAMAYYPKKTEQVLWVKIAPNAKPEAERTLQSIHVRLPGLQFREVDLNFDRCPPVSN